MVIQGARESVFVTKADHSFFTEPVSCLVFNAVGSTNVSILVDVHCKKQFENKFTAIIYLKKINKYLTHVNEIINLLIKAFNQIDLSIHQFH